MISRLGTDLKRLPMDFLGLFFPRICLACEAQLMQAEDHICTHCLLHLPYAELRIDGSTELERLFAGRLPLAHAVNLLSFEQGGRVQSLLHQLKYQGQYELGVLLGRMLGDRLKEIDHPILSASFIVPLPLHPKRERIRGYNQSEAISSGLSEAMQIPMALDWVRRKRQNESQTALGRAGRWARMEGIFELHTDRISQDENLILVDDVVTTGSTMESFARAFLKHGNHELSVVSLAAA